jgi:hypothetical protein
MDYPPDRIIYDVVNRVLLDSDGTQIASSGLLPSATMGDRRWYNAQLVIDSELTPYEIPLGTTANVFIDNDFRGGNPVIPLRGGVDNWANTLAISTSTTKLPLNPITFGLTVLPPPREHTIP